MNTLSTVGRILFSLPFFVFGINHFVMFDYYMGLLTSFIPFGGYLIILTGFIMIATSLSIIFKRFVQITSITLASMLFIFILVIHIPNLFDEQNHIIGLISLLKDTSLMGGALLIAGVFKDKQKISHD